MTRSYRRANSRRIRAAWRRTTLWAAAAAAAATAGPARAVTYTWTGAGATLTNGWSSPFNWASGIPVSAATTDVIFAGTTGLTPDQNIANPFVLNTLTFNAGAGAFTLGGSPLQFNNNDEAAAIRQMSANAQRVNEAITLNANLNVDVTFGSSLTLAGAVGETGGARMLVKNDNGDAGLGTLVLTGANTYTGGTTVNAGTLVLGRAGGTLSAAGGVVVNQATVQLGTAAGNNNVLGTAAASIPGVTVNSFGTLTVNGGTTQTLGPSAWPSSAGSTSATAPPPRSTSSDPSPR